MKKITRHVLTAGLLFSTALGVNLLTGTNQPQTAQAAGNIEAIVHGGSQPIASGYGDSATYLRDLPDGSRWQAFKAIIDPSGVEWFDLGGDQWIKADNAWLNDYYSIPVINLAQFANDDRNVVVVTSDSPATLWDGYGKNRSASGRTLDLGSAWVATAQKRSGGRTWYEVSTNQWLSADDVALNHTWHDTGDSGNGNTSSDNNNNGGTDTTNPGTSQPGGSGNSGSGTTDNSHGSTGSNPGTSTGTNDGGGNTGSGTSTGGGTTTGSGDNNPGTGSPTGGDKVVGSLTPMNLTAEVHPKDADVKARGKGGVIVVAYDRNGVPLNNGIYVEGNVGDHYTIPLPKDLLDPAHNVYNAKDGKTEVTGVIKKTGIEEVDVDYGQNNVQKLDLNTLKESAYQLMDQYRSSKGLPTFRRDANLERNAQQDIDNISKGYDSSNPYASVTYFSANIGNNNQEVGYDGLTTEFNRSWFVLNTLGVIGDSTQYKSVGIGVAYDPDTNRYLFEWTPGF
ncbi:MAG: CAP domain-containing protein [Lactobacillus sp.]|nr:CAP domain-containing protein [Lactobacillus sp.]